MIAQPFVAQAVIRSVAVSDDGKYQSKFQAQIQDMTQGGFMPTQFQMFSEMDAMMVAMILAANLIAIVAFLIVAVYAVGLAAMALSEKLQSLKRTSLPKIQVVQLKPSATRTVLQ